MFDNKIVLWSIRNKTSEKIVRLRHSKGDILITPWGWHGKRRIQISQKSQQFVGKMKCNTNRDVKSNNPVFDQDTGPRNTPSRGQFVVLLVTQPYGNFILWSNTDLLINMPLVYLPNIAKKYSTIFPKIGFL